jgi:hypothetical protein
MGAPAIFEKQIEIKLLHPLRLHADTTPIYNFFVTGYFSRQIISNKYTVQTYSKADKIISPVVILESVFHADTKSRPESVTSSVDVGCKSMISIYLSKIAGSPQFLGNKADSMACALRRYKVTDSGQDSTSACC